MAEVRGCHLPDEPTLRRRQPHLVPGAARRQRCRLGMTTVATAMAGQLVAFTPKKAGRTVEPGKTCATVESGKWVGPAKTGGRRRTVVAVNDALVARPVARERRIPTARAGSW
ncbi:MAG: hypothetical protein RML56_06560 [Burkholderiales bacterium]|nr:hypothetical protein [Burkholderiales bacterium]